MSGKGGGSGAAGKKGTYLPFHRYEKYPRSMQVDFRKLEYRSLQSYVEHYNINVRPDSTQAELAVAVARHFEARPVNEEGVLGDFIRKCHVPGKPFQPMISLDAYHQHQMYGGGGGGGGGGMYGGGGNGFYHPEQQQHHSAYHHQQVMQQHHHQQQQGAERGSGGKKTGRKAAGDDGKKTSGKAGSQANGSGGGGAGKKRKHNNGSSSNGAGGGPGGHANGHANGKGSGNGHSNGSGNGHGAVSGKRDSGVGAVAGTPIVNPKMGRARSGEQVAALDDNEWILARATRYHADIDQYDVKDEDDHDRVIRVPAEGILRLEDSVEGIAKGDEVLAVFPDTTSFYRGKVFKMPKKEAIANTDKKRPELELLVKFADDDDENGRTPQRRLVARYVLAIHKADTLGGADGDEDDMETEKPVKEKGGGRGRR